MAECLNQDSIPKSRIIAFHDEDVDEDEGLNVSLAMPADPWR